MLAPSQKAAAGGRCRGKPAVRLGPLELEVIGLFVQLARSWGRPTSLGETYGLLFVSARPLAVEDLAGQLGLSRGAAYQDLSFLRSIGAVRIVYVAGDRRMHYEAVAELHGLMTRLLQERLAPHLDASRVRLRRAARLVRQLPREQRARLAGRLKTLQNWERNVRRFLPHLAAILAQ